MNDENEQRYVYPTADSGYLKLRLRPRSNGEIWAWLEQSTQEPIIVTPDQSRAIIDALTTLARLVRRGHQTVDRTAVIVQTESGKRTILVFGIRNGSVTSWRDGEHRDPIALDPEATDELVATWRIALAEAERM